MTTRSISDLQDHSCGLCGRPNCISYILEGGPRCPFEGTSHHWKEDDMKEALEGVLVSNRTRPMLQEATPCSEYTRYTIEGVLSDPLDPQKNAVFESSSLGTLFRSSRYHGKKWSEPLGYGIAMMGEDIRIHLQCRGKIIIRRAMERGSANDLYLEVADLMRPAVYCSIGGHTLADTIRSLRRNATEPPHCLEPMLSWPRNEGPDDTGRILETYEKYRSDLGERLVKDVMSILSRDGPEPGMGAKVLSALETEMSEEGMVTDEDERSLGRRSFLVQATKGLDGVMRFLYSIQNAEPDSRASLLEMSREMLRYIGSEEGCPEKLVDHIKWGDQGLRHVWKFVFHLS